MVQSSFALLKTRRFWPLFVTQFLGAFNDNVFRNALVILITYRLGAAVTDSPHLLVTLAAGVFILPFFLFSALAGEIADKYDKAWLIRRIKLGEVVLMTLGALAFAVGNLWFLLGVLFLMGMQSAFFGPLKYAILPDHLQKGELVGGNGLIQASSYVAILFGTILGGIVVLRDGGLAAVALVAISVAALGYLASCRIPATSRAAPGLRLTRNPVEAIVSIMRYAVRPPEVFLAVLGISWFWLVGATFLAQLPNVASRVLFADEGVVVLFLILFAVGVGVGALLCNRLLDGRISPRLTPWAAAVIAGASLHLLWGLSGADVPRDGSLMPLAGFLAVPHNWLIALDLFLIAAAGGTFVVPLYALMQARTDDRHRSRVIAALNIMNSAFMVLSAVISIALLAAGVPIEILVTVTGALTLPVGIVLARRLGNHS